MTQWDAVLAAQRGLVTREQCLRAGMTDRAVEWRVGRGSWVRVHRGVYLTRPGRDGWTTQAMAALLACGRPSALAGTSAGFAWGLIRAPGPTVEVAIPVTRQVRRRLEGVSVRRMAHCLERTHETAWPHRTTVEHTLLDLALGRPLDHVLGMVARAAQTGMTSPALVGRALELRPGQPGAALLREALLEVADGSESPAELRYVRDVEAPHGLPRASRQTAAGGGRRRDLEYEEYALVVEVDGRLGHEGWDGRRRDGRRDRQALVAGRVTVRVHWPDVALEPCALAVEMGELLRQRGWQGRLRPCRRHRCAVRQVVGLPRHRVDG